MSDTRFGILELALFFGPVLGWACWELWSLSRYRRRERAQSALRAIRNGNKA